jgi:hypothetical protein
MISDNSSPILFCREKFAYAWVLKCSATQMRLPRSLCNPGELWIHVTIHGSVGVRRGLCSGDERHLCLHVLPELSAHPTVCLSDSAWKEKVTDIRLF